MKITARILGTKRCFQWTLVAACVLAMSAADVMASSYGSYGSYGSSGSYGSYGSSGSYGGGLFSRIRERRATRRAARASYGSYGSYASSGSYGSYGSQGSYGSTGSYGSAGSYGGSVVYSGAVEFASSAPSMISSSAIADATIKVSLPEDAIVLVNGKPTTSKGISRSYVSRGLRSGKTYSYKLQVEFQRDGQTVVEHKTLRVTAGQSLSVSFGQEAGPQLVADVQTVKTVLSIQVPEQAVVFLASVATAEIGTVREFTTSQLSKGQAWNDYTVRVELDRDGEKLVQERTLQVVGGGFYELAFDFDEPTTDLQLAQLTK